VKLPTGSNFPTAPLRSTRTLTGISMVTLLRYSKLTPASEGIKH
jgi:hypothetical protein